MRGVGLVAGRWSLAAGRWRGGRRAVSAGPELAEGEARLDEARPSECVLANGQRVAPELEQRAGLQAGSAEGLAAAAEGALWAISVEPAGGGEEGGDMQQRTVAAGPMGAGSDAAHSSRRGRGGEEEGDDQDGERERDEEEAGQLRPARFFKTAPAARTGPAIVPWRVVRGDLAPGRLLGCFPGEGGASSVLGQRDRVQRYGVHTCTCGALLRRARCTHSGTELLIVHNSGRRVCRNPVFFGVFAFLLALARGRGRLWRLAGWLTGRPGRLSAQ